MDADDKINRILGKDEEVLKKIYGDKERFSSDRMDNLLGKSKKEKKDSKITCPKCGHEFKVGDSK